MKNRLCKIRILSNEITIAEEKIIDPNVQYSNIIYLNWSPGRKIDGKKLTELSDLWYDSKWSNISVIEVQEGKERREKDREREKKTDRKNTFENDGWKFYKFEKNYKPRDSRMSTNSSQD